MIRFGWIMFRWWELGEERLDEVMMLVDLMLIKKVEYRIIKMNTSLMNLSEERKRMNFDWIEIILMRVGWELDER